MSTPRRFLALIPALALFQMGCGGEAPDFPREPIAGKVTLDGRPLEEGLITFTPVDRPEPVVSGLVTDGQFAIDRPDGPAPGAHRVSIWASKPTGKKVRDPDQPGQTIDEVRSIVPERYNVRTELTAEVAPGSDNAFEFAIAGAPARPKQQAQRPRGLVR